MGFLLDFHRVSIGFWGFFGFKQPSIGGLKHPHWEDLTINNRDDWDLSSEKMVMTGFPDVVSNHQQEGTKK